MTNVIRNFVSVKNASEIKLDGITVALDKANDSLKAVYLSDGKGGVLRIVLDSYSICAQVPAPPKKEKRYVLRGTVDGIGRIERQFESQFDADQARREIESKLRGDFDFTVTHEEVELPNDSAPPVSDDPIPF